MDAIINDLKQNPTNVINNLTQVKYKKLLIHLLKSYHTEGISLISDALYDILIETYIEKYGDFNLEIEEEVEKKIISNKVELPYYMGSQKKLKTKNEFDNWIKKYDAPYNISYKIDGLSSIIIKKDDKVYMFSKNVSGNTGFDKSRLLDKINVNINNLKNGDCIRGELIHSRKNFLKIADTAKNPRASVAGIINSKTIDIEKLKLVDFIGYAVMNPPMKIQDQFYYIEKLKMSVVHYENKNKLSMDELSDILLYARQNYGYDTDGLVVSSGNKIYPIIPDKKYPDNSFAFKTILNDQQAETTVLRVIYEIQKEGYLKPRIEFEPVEILGTTNSFVTGNNCKFIKDNVIGPGSVIIIIKSGDIINKIHKVIKPSDTGVGQMPDCDYKWTDTGVDVIATNIDEEQESDIIIKQLIYTINILGISFMGQGTIQKFVENGYNSFFKILKAKKEDLIEIDGFSNKIIDKIYNSIEERLMTCELHEFMVSSNCFGRGSSTRKIKSITDIHPTIINIFEQNPENAYELIINIHGFEKTSTDKIINGFPQYIKWQTKLLKIKPDLKFNIIKNINKKEETEIQDNIFKGKNIIFSGFRDIEFEKKLENLGAKIVTSISKNTNILIVNNKTDTSSKITKANSLNIIIMDINDLITELDKY
jgi:DNA ligase (NAD+)